MVLPNNIRNFSYAYTTLLHEWHPGNTPVAKDYRVRSPVHPSSYPEWVHSINVLTTDSFAELTIEISLPRPSRPAVTVAHANIRLVVSVLH